MSIKTCLEEFLIVLLIMLDTSLQKCKYMYINGKYLQKKEAA